MINPSLRYINRQARIEVAKDGHLLKRFKVSNSGTHAKTHCVRCGHQVWTAVPHDGPAEIERSAVNKVCRGRP